MLDLELPVYLPLVYRNPTSYAIIIATSDNSGHLGCFFLTAHVLFLQAL
jgi:hypothetical protein